MVWDLRVLETWFGNKALKMIEVDVASFLFVHEVLHASSAEIQDFRLSEG